MLESESVSRHFRQNMGRCSLPGSRSAAFGPLPGRGTPAVGFSGSGDRDLSHVGRLWRWSVFFAYTNTNKVKTAIAAKTEAGRGTISPLRTCFANDGRLYEFQAVSAQTLNDSFVLTNVFIFADVAKMLAASKGVEGSSCTVRHTRDVPPKLGSEPAIRRSIRGVLHSSYSFSATSND